MRSKPSKRGDAKASSSADGEEIIVQDRRQPVIIIVAVY
jgi:hypothetical protein